MSKSRFIKGMTAAMAVSLALPFASLPSAHAATLATQVQVTSFSDISNSYAKQEILDLARAGVLNGIGGGKFDPSGSITFDQFYVILAKSFRLTPVTTGLEPQATGDGAGVYVPYANTAEWAKPYRAALSSNQRDPRGQEQQSSTPQTITREEMIVKMLNSLGLGNQAQHDGIASTFSDVDQISEPARPYVALAQQIGLIQGKPDAKGGVYFDPKAFLQRQEAALLAHDFYFGKDAMLKTGQDFVKNHPSLRFVQPGDNALLLGTGPANSTVAVQLDDGRQVYHRTATVAQGGTFDLSSSLDMALLKPGNVNVSAVFTNAAGASVGNASMSFTMPVLKNVFEGARVGNSEAVTDANQTSYVMYGVAAPNVDLRPCAMDQQGHVVSAKPVTSGPNGAWQTTIDLSTMPDGTIFLFGDTSDQNMAVPYFMNLAKEVTKQ